MNLAAQRAGRRGQGDRQLLLLGSGQMTLLGSLVLLVSTQAALLLVSWLLVLRPNALATLPRWDGLWVTAGNTHMDNFIDGAGYQACAGEVAQRLSDG